MRQFTVRDLGEHDADAVWRLHNGDFPFPNLRSRLYLCRKVVTADGAVIAAGFCRLTSEGILILDETQPRTLKCRAVAALVEEMIEETSKMGMDECHVFAQNPSIGLLLEKLGFVQCSGVPMVVIYGQERKKRNASSSKS